VSFINCHDKGAQSNNPQRETWCLVIYSIISSVLTPSYFIVWTATCTLPEEWNICCRTFIVSAGCPINNPHMPVSVGKYCETFIALFDTWRPNNKSEWWAQWKVRTCQTSLSLLSKQCCHSGELKVGFQQATTTTTNSIIIIIIVIRYVCSQIC
jgi:hypothetical protein